MRARGRRTLGILATLFFLPLALAFWMYYGGGWRPATQANTGELVVPARPLPAESLPRLDGTQAPILARGKWTLVYVGDGACDAACRRALLVMRQTRLALHNDMTRVERTMLATSDCCARTFLEREHPGLAVFDASGGNAGDLLAQFPADERAYSIYTVDPLGNLMMRHDARADPKGLLRDLERVLKLSHVG